MLFYWQVLSNDELNHVFASRQFSPKSELLLSGGIRSLAIG